MMRKMNPLVIAAIFLMFSQVLYSQETPKENETIWQKKAGDIRLNWEGQVFHLGNGYFGASSYGAPQQEIITLSEKTFWTGGPGDRTDYNFGIGPNNDLTVIDQIKRLTSEGNIAEADKLVAKSLNGDSWQGLGGLSTIGSLFLNFDSHNGEIQNYERILDLHNSTLTIKYRVNGVNYKREYFCSYPARILALRITADKPNAISFNLGLNLMHKKRNPVKTITHSTGMFEIAGNMDDNNRPYRVKIKVENDGGELLKNDTVLIVKGSSSVNIYYSIATNYELNPPLFKGADPDKITTDAIDNASKSGYKKLREVHIADYQKLYNRTSLHLVNSEINRESLPTNERLGYYIHNDNKDLGLKELAFNLGKYMLISVSRPGTMATGNQGIWNNRYQAMWNGTYQLDMNVTQAYMFGNALNLSECQEPFVDYVKMLSGVGTIAAKSFYGTNGWMSCVISDLWGGVGTLPPAPFISSGWLSLIIWEQYAFDKNENYLKEIYPVLKGAAQFYLENLIEYKDTKKLVFWGTYSAEHSSSPIGVTAPNFQDIAFISETFENTIKASELLNLDKAFHDQLIKAKSRLMPFKIGRLGQFQEWVEDVDDPNCQHRHLSHLLALQPCKQINPFKEPAALIDAIKVTLRQRGDNDFVTLHRPDLGNSTLFPTKCKHEGMSYDYYTSQAWSRNARLSTWLRVFDGDHANKIYNDILRESTLDNMIQYETRAHYGDQPVPETPFFMESTILAAGQVTEMVLQSQYGELVLLPALPSAWATGSIKGIRARGACTIDIEWKDGKLVKARIQSDQGGAYTIRYNGKIKVVNLKSNESIMVNESLSLGN